jgi:DHA1 family tetracycline resistance protein-like MFS transporter
MVFYSNLAIQGFLGYLFCALSFFTLYISDSTPKNDRAPFFAHAEGILMLAFAIGPFVGGLIQSKGGSTLFWISILLNFLVIFLIMALLPESLPREKRKIITSTVFNFSHSFINMARSLQAMPKDVFLIAVAFCLFKSSISADSQFFLYAAFKFGWDARDEGQYLLYGFSWNMVFLLVLLPLIAKIRKGRDLEKVKVLAAVEVCAIMCMAFAGNTVAIYTITVFKKMSVMSSPFVRNIQTSRVSQDNMGGMFSGIQLLEQLFSIVSAPLFSFIWSQSASWMPNMMFFANAGFVFGALLILLPLRDSSSGSE